MSRAIIFGAGGQTGHYLGELLSQRDVEVLRVSRSSDDRAADVGRFSDVENIIREDRPDIIFHLAARSSTRHDALFANHAAITTGVLNVLEAARRHAPHARIFITGSGLQFVNTGEPIDENAPFDASSPYAVARISSVYTARYYRRLGLPVYVGYLFHHESPLRPPEHVSQKVARAAAAIAAGRQNHLELGDLTVAKEWTFAGDVAAGIMTLMDQNRIDEAVIGSGNARTIKQWVEACFAVVHLDWEKYVRTIPGFEPEYRRLVSNPASLLSLGWRPRMAVSELAALMVNAAAVPSRRG